MFRIFLLIVIGFVAFPIVVRCVEKVCNYFRRKTDDVSIGNKSESIKHRQKELVNDIKAKKKSLIKEQKEVEKIEKDINK